MIIPSTMVVSVVIFILQKLTTYTLRANVYITEILLTLNNKHLLKKSCQILGIFFLFDVNVNEKNMTFGFNNAGKHEFISNALNFISKWSIWKARNKVKYDQIHINKN